MNVTPVSSGPARQHYPTPIEREVEQRYHEHIFRLLGYGPPPEPSPVTPILRSIADLAAKYERRVA